MKRGIVATPLALIPSRTNTFFTVKKRIFEFGNEFNILLDVSKKELLSKNVSEKLTELILKNRVGKINVKPGFDGEYGVAQMEGEQKALF